ncbi:MAG: DUF92 domain-containing protein [Candidatus Marinimicrobia bacterium]|nr:DUF92 domain-containing protein [Candidatus Neomarinimicrobiota bacterium]
MLLENDWFLVLVYFVILIILVVISDVLYKKFDVSGKITRRIVHISVGLVICTTPFILDNWLPPALLATMFIIANTIAIKNKMMQGIHSAPRISYGTVFFPISYLVLILLFWRSAPGIIIISMLLLTISDPLAAIIGEKYGVTFNKYLHDEKSYKGLISVFISSFLLTLISLIIMSETGFIDSISMLNIFVISISVALIAVPAEAVSIKGTDNLSLPLLSAIMLSIMWDASLMVNIQNLAWIFLAIGVAIGSFYAGALSANGTAGAVVVGSFIFTIGGLAWLIPLGIFFILSSLLSKIGKKRKTSLKNIVIKGGRRDISQVYANGGVALVLVIIYHFVSDPIFYIMFLGSLAAANADTWETEIGTYFKRGTRSIINFLKVPPGTSGGVSIIGTMGGIFGAGLIALSVMFYHRPDLDRLLIFIITTVSGILGSIADSYSGALLQAQYTCSECSLKTERLIHCNTATRHTAGIKWINNDMVNLICTISGALIALLCYSLCSVW